MLATQVRAHRYGVDGENKVGHSRVHFSSLIDTVEVGGELVIILPNGVVFSDTSEWIASHSSKGRNSLGVVGRI